MKLWRVHLCVILRLRHDAACHLFYFLGWPYESHETRPHSSSCIWTKNADMAKVLE